MEATKQYQFASLLCMLIASVFMGFGVITALKHVVMNEHMFWVLPLTICMFFGAIGQAQMIETLGNYLKNKN